MLAVDTDRIKGLVDAVQSRFEAQFSSAELGPPLALVQCYDPPHEDAIQYAYIAVVFPENGTRGSDTAEDALAGWEIAAAIAFDGDTASKKLIWRIPLEVDVFPGARKTYFRAYGRAVAIPFGSVIKSGQ